MISSLDQSLRRMGLEYVDIFYSHRPDPNTPVEETMDALACAIRQGKALYAGISNYSAEQTKTAIDALRKLGVCCLLHQPKYSMLDRWVEGGLTAVLKDEGVGMVAFSPLAQGVLSGRYLGGIPSDARAAKGGSLSASTITPQLLSRLARLNALAQARGQTLAQLALAWVLRQETAASVIIGASSVAQITENAACISNLGFTVGELDEIDPILAE